MTSTTVLSPLADALRTACRGAVHLPGDAGFDQARAAWNLAVDQRPAAVAEPSDADDVAAVVRVAAAHGLRVAPQGTGHGASALGGAHGALLLRTHGLREIAVDPEARTVRVGAGALWGDVVAACAPYGLAPLAGSAGDVGVVGYTLGGGLSFLGRRFGLASGHVVAAELVTADGELVVADDDLLWAVRGGGGGLGVVTSLTLALQPVPALVCGQLFFGIERAAEVLAAWRDWCATAPEEITTSARLMRFPPFETVPAPLRGGAFVVIDGAFAGAEPEAAEALAPLRALEPLMDMWAPAPGLDALCRLHLDPPAPVPALTEHALLAELDDATLAGLVAAAGADSGTSLVAVELRQLGGALARPAGDGALSCLDAPFCLFAVGVPAPPASPQQVAADLARVLAAAAPVAAGRLGSWAEHPGQPSTFAPQAAARVKALRDRLDPDRRFLTAGD